MSLTPQWLDELRARTTLSTLIGKSIKVQKAGREYKGLLPLPQREDAQLHDQRREGFLSLLRLRGAWRCNPLDD